MEISPYWAFATVVAGLIAAAVVQPVPACAKVPETGRALPFPNAPFTYRYEASQVTVSTSSTGARVARYDLADLTFCEGPGDNCVLDGMFGIVAAGLTSEPVLVVIAHVGAHGQKLSVFRPQADAARPVFEAAADYALSYTLHEGRLSVTVDRADGNGAVKQEHLSWPACAACD